MGLQEHFERDVCVYRERILVLNYEKKSLTPVYIPAPPTYFPLSNFSPSSFPHLSLSSQSSTQANLKIYKWHNQSLYYNQAQIND